MPRFDSPAVFAEILGDEDAGTWSLLPEKENYQTKQYYLRNTNVCITEYHLENGDRYDVCDFAPRFDKVHDYYRPPQLMRIIRPVKGTPRLRVKLNPRFDYGRIAPDTSISGDSIVYRSGSYRLFLETDLPFTYVLSEQPFELTGTRYAVLSHGEPFGQPLKFACEEYLDRTIAYWRKWVKHCNTPFEYQNAVIRSALALKLHVYEDTGAIIAATTTSIPESPTGGRNWDYRYCWLRDAYFVVHVLNQLGQFEEMEKFLQFLHNLSVAEPNADIQPVYGIGGERDLTERILPWLKGFRGLGPVRVGNAAYSHAQYDAYGEMVLAIAPLFFDNRLDRIDLERAFESVRQLVERAIHTFDAPDAGIWEFRGDRQHHLFSKVMSWAAVDRGLKIASRMGMGERFPSWTAACERMRTTIEDRGWNPTSKMYTQIYGSADADASNLLMSALNFHPGQNERFRSTVEQYEKMLMQRGYVFRYRNSDDFGLPEHAFSICNFWMVDALVAVGRTEEARQLFERLLKCSNHVGLMSEDIDPVGHELWGNFPQAYSHVGIINSAFRLSKSWNDAF